MYFRTRECQCLYQCLYLCQCLCLNNQHLISEKCVQAPNQSEATMDNGEGCPIEHVFYGGEIINCEKCSKVEHSKDEIGQREGVQCPTDHIRYFCDSCSSSTLSEENMERCSSTPLLGKNS